MKILIIFIGIYVVYRILSSVNIKVVRLRGPVDLSGRQRTQKDIQVDGVSTPRHQSAREAEDTVTCAACGAYLPINSALRRVDGGVERHFCTLPCKDAKDVKDTGDTHV